MLIHLFLLLVYMFGDLFSGCSCLFCCGLWFAVAGMFYGCVLVFDFDLISVTFLVCLFFVVVCV